MPIQAATVAAEQERPEMKVRTRFLKSVIATAKATETRLPWARGKARQALIQHRAQPAAPVRARLA
jgi:hypothetical protein